LAWPLAPDELEDKLQKWDVGRTARTWIGLDKIEKLIGLTPADFAHYRSTVVGRTVAESGFDFEEVRRKVARVFIFDRQAVKAKTAEADIIPIRVWKEFEELYVSKYNTDSTVFDDCVFQQRQLKSNRGSYSLAHEVFGITQSRIALKSRIESLQLMGLLPEATQPIAPPAASNMSPQLQRHEQRAAKRALDDLHSLEEKEKYAGVSAAVSARSLVDSVDNLTDSPCVMMILVEEWVLGSALLDERLADDFSSMSPHAFEIRICRELGATVDRFGEDFPALLLSSARLSPLAAEIRSSCPQPAQLLRASDVADIYRRYKSKVVGASAPKSRVRRLEFV